MSQPWESTVEYAVRTMNVDNHVVFHKISQQAYNDLVRQGGFRADLPVPIYDALPDLNAYDIERNLQSDREDLGIPVLLQESQERSLLRAAFLLEAAARAIRCIVRRVDQPSLLAEATRLAREAGTIIEDHQEIIAYDRPMTQAERQAIRAAVIAECPDARWIFESAT